MILRRHFILLLFLVMILRCHNATVSTLNEYLAWLSAPENGLIQTKHINGLEVKAKYMPPEYMAYLELKEKSTFGKEYQDSILGTYKKGISFLFTIGPDENKSNENDIMTSGVANYQEYTEKVMTMNFEIGEYIKLKTEKGEYRPVLTNLENTYGLTKNRNIVLVFIDEENTENILNAGVYDLVYEDELFGLGTNHFTFNKKDINRLPELTFWKN